MELQEEMIQTASPKSRKFLLRQVRLDIGNLREFSCFTVRRVLQGFTKNHHRALVSTYLWQSWLLVQTEELPPPLNLEHFWQTELKPFYIENRLGFSTATLLDRAAAVLGYPARRYNPSEPEIYAELLRAAADFRAHGILNRFARGGSDLVHQARLILLFRSLLEPHENK